MTAREAEIFTALILAPAMLVVPMLIVFAIGTWNARSKGRKWMNTTWLIWLSAAWAMLPAWVHPGRYTVDNTIALGLWVGLLFGVRGLWRMWRA